jgi:PKD repeat protein
MKNFFILAGLFLITCYTNAQNSNIDSIVNHSFSSKSELYFSFQKQSDDIMFYLTRIISIDNVKNNEVIAVANKKGFSLFLEHGIPYTLLPSPYETVPPEAFLPGNMIESIHDKTTYSWDSYPTYQAYLDMMAQFQNDFPAICRIDTIGYSVQGRLLLAAVISNNVNVDEYEPEFFYTSTMHGDEITGFVLMLRLIDYLLNNYGANTDVTNLVNNVKIFINPNANPDGTYYAGNNSNVITGSRRFNFNGIDLNRNYPVPNGLPYGEGPRQIETQYFIDYATKQNFIIAANFHGGAELMNYPWDYTTTNHPDKLWWSFICTEYAQSAQNNSPSNYFVDYYPGFDSPGVTEGAEWYVAIGTRQDYMQYFANCREVTAEISAVKNPPASTLPNYWNYNHQALILYMKQALYGFKGIVTDACTNLPLKAKIELTGHDAQNSHVYSSTTVGNFHRPVKAGTYTVKASATGYADQQYANVAITDYNSVIRDFQLAPLSPTAQFTASDRFTCNGEIQFTNSSIAPQDVVYTWHFGDGTTSTDINPVHFYQFNGTYDVKLIASSCAGIDSLIRYAYIEVNMPALPVASDQSRCGPGTLTLQASSQGSIYWWDATGSTQLETGNLFTTPYLTQTTQYLVSSFEDVAPCEGGKPDTSGNGNFIYPTNEMGLILNAHKPFIINSAVVYAQNAGNRTFKLNNASDNTLAAVTINVPAGQSVIQLGFEVPVGTGYKLLGPVNSGLFVNQSTSNIGYPFDICNLATIVSSSEQLNPLLTYPYFYNIEIEEQTHFFGALINKTTNGQYFTSSVPHGLYFDCNAESTLKSVKVYSNLSGNRTISLRDASDHLIADTTINIPSGEHRIELNFPIPAQNGLKLIGPVTPNLWRDGGTTTPVLPYPFTVGDVINITGNSANNLRYYYYFYDWEVEKQTGCESPKISVSAHIFDTPSSDFTYNINLFDVAFNNLSTGGGTYHWDFGDGSFSQDENPVHTYATSGNYTVNLTLTNDCGTDVSTQQLLITFVTVLSSGQNIEVFPNPFDDVLQIRSEHEIQSFKIFNLQGIMLLYGTPFLNEIRIQMAGFPKGVYFLQVTNEHTTIPILIVKQ